MCQPLMGLAILCMASESERESITHRITFWQGWETWNQPRIELLLNFFLLVAALRYRTRVMTSLLALLNQSPAIVFYRIRRAKRCTCIDFESEACLSLIFILVNNIKNDWAERKCFCTLSKGSVFWALFWTHNDRQMSMWSVSAIRPPSH